MGPQGQGDLSRRICRGSGPNVAQVGAARLNRRVQLEPCTGSIGVSITHHMPMAVRMHHMPLTPRTLPGNFGGSNNELHSNAAGGTSLEKTVEWARVHKKIDIDRMTISRMSKSGEAPQKRGQLGGAQRNLVVLQEAKNVRSTSSTLSSLCASKSKNILHIYIYYICNTAIIAINHEVFRILIAGASLI